MIKQAIRLSILVLVSIFSVFGTALASDVLFVIRDKVSGKTFEVTDQVIATHNLYSFKAVLPGSDGAIQEVRGPLLRDLLKQSGFTIAKVTAIALDRYEMDIPTEDYQTFDVIMAVEVAGKKLSVRDKGPAWIIYPNVDYPQFRDPVFEARSVWQVKELVIE